MRLKNALGAKIGGHSVEEFKYNGQIIWPIWSLSLSESSLAFTAQGGTKPLYVYLSAVNGLGTSIKRVQLSESDLTITKYGDSAGRVSRSGLSFSASNLGTTAFDAVSGYYEITYTPKNLTVQLPFNQALNRIEQTIAAHEETTGIGSLAFSPANVPVLGGGVDVTAVRTYKSIDAEYIWSSTAHSGGAVHTGQTETVTPTSVECATSMGYSGATLYFASNAHHEQSISHAVKATYDGVSSSWHYITQLADSYTPVTQRYDYEAHISIISSGGLTAQGGSCSLSASGTKHKERTEYRWASGGSTYSDERDVADSYRFEAIGDAASRFTISGDNVTHLNMQDRSVDSFAFRCCNLGDETAYADTTTLTINNAATPHSQSVFDLYTDYVGNIPGEGDDNIPVKYKSYNETWTTYQSQYETEHTKTHSRTDLATSIGSLSRVDTEAAEGTVYLSVGQNPSTWATRTVNVTMSQTGTAKDTLAFTQDYYVSPAQSISVTESVHSGYRDVTISNNYTSALAGYVRCEIYDDYGSYVTTQDLSFSLASGASATSRISYGYGYSVTYTTYLA